MPGEHVSRRHCSLIPTGTGLTLLDQGSLNGSFVNGSRERSVELSANDVVRIGDWVGVCFQGGADEPEHSLSEIVAGRRLRWSLSRARAIAPTDLPVALSGESGVGKEVLARFVHSQSGRSGPFVAINCASIPEGLAEAELFGHARGSFTGAFRDRDGVFVQANGGTLFLDEISDLPIGIQAKLLRALEESSVRPVGASSQVRVDVRVIVAGKERLADLVGVEAFRGDLYARLNGFELVVPPLRERRDEILELFRRTYLARAGRAATLTPEFAELLLLYDWPYNVRELIQMTRGIVALHHQSPRLTLEQAPSALRKQRAKSLGNASDSEPQHVGGQAWSSYRKDFRDAQLSQLRQALNAYGGNVTRAAAAVGISRGRAYRLMGTQASKRNESTNLAPD